LLFVAKFGLRSGDGFSVTRLIVASIALGWLPLLLLTLAAGTAYGDRVAMPFLHDFLPYGRNLIAVPLLLLMTVIVQRHTTMALAYMRDSGLIAEPDAAVQRIVLTASHVWHSPLLRLALFLLTYISAGLVFWWARASDVSSWMFEGEAGAEHLSWAGAWSVLISGALLKFLVINALCKLVIWVWVLWRVSGLRLQLSPLHPDQRCGLRFLGRTQLAFSPLISALSVQLGCVIAVGVRYQGHDLAGSRWVAAVFVALSLALLMGPLLVFARRAERALEDAGLTFSAWASHAARYIAAKRVAPHCDPADQLSQPEISAFTDASATFANLMVSRPIPFGRFEVMAVLTSAIVPMLLPLVALLPLATIMQELMKVIL